MEPGSLHEFNLTKAEHRVLGMFGPKYSRLDKIKRKEDRNKLHSSPNVVSVIKPTNR